MRAALGVLVDLDSNQCIFHTTKCEVIIELKSINRKFSGLLNNVGSFATQQQLMAKLYAVTIPVMQK